MAATELATLGGGCFWCVEAPMKELRGVHGVTSGYAGGHAEDPTYEQVCSGSTGHAEVVQVEFDPEEIGYRDLLEVFFAIHDPTTENRQGPDVGSQYRSAIYYHSETQRETAEATIEELEANDTYDGIVTEVEPLETFYEAEEHHQDYYENNPSTPYCSVNIPPKLKKVRNKFPEIVMS